MSVSDGLRNDLARAKRIAKLLDSQFGFGPARFGLDAIVGLVPVAGDIVTSLIACYPIVLARKHGAPLSLVRPMLINVGVDWLVGLVPVAGDLFDVTFKANLRNVALFERWAKTQAEPYAMNGGRGASADAA